MLKEKQITKDRILTFIGSLLCIILTPILVINIILIAKSYIYQDEVPSLGGYLPLIVLTDSMYPEIESGDLIICNKTNAADIKVNDVISFFDPAGNGSSIVTHRVTEIVNENGNISFRTRGDNNNAEDKLLVPAENIVGTFSARFGGVGNAAMFMQSSTGLIICVVFPIIVLIAYDFIRRSIYEKNRRNDTALLLAELEALRAEKSRISNNE